MSLTCKINNKGPSTETCGTPLSTENHLDFSPFTFPTQQHGFTYQKSCFTNLLETFEDRTTSNDQGYSVEKAFDSVLNQRLLMKLAGYGITVVSCAADDREL